MARPSPVEESVLLRDGTRIRVTEEVLQDGRRRVTREVVDASGGAPSQNEVVLRQAQDGDDAGPGPGPGPSRFLPGRGGSRPLPHPEEYSVSDTSGWMSQDDTMESSGGSTPGWDSPRDPRTDLPPWSDPSRSSIGAFGEGASDYSSLPDHGGPDHGGPDHGEADPGTHRASHREMAHFPLGPREGRAGREAPPRRKMAEGPEQKRPAAWPSSNRAPLQVNRWGYSGVGSLLAAAWRPFSPLPPTGKGGDGSAGGRGTAQSAAAASLHCQKAEPEPSPSKDVPASSPFTYIIANAQQVLADLRKGRKAKHLRTNADLENQKDPGNSKHNSNKAAGQRERKPPMNNWKRRELLVCLLLIGAILGFIIMCFLPKRSERSQITGGTPTEALLQPTSPLTFAPSIQPFHLAHYPTPSPAEDDCGELACEWSQYGNELVGANFGDAAGTSTALSADGTVVAVGGIGTFASGGTVRIYVQRSSSWIQKGQTIEGLNEYDRFGLSVALSSDGNVVAIGGDGWDGNGVNKGVVRVFSYDSKRSKWVQRGDHLHGDISFDRAGWSVSLSSSGDVLAFGATGSPSGYVRMFLWTGLKWDQLGDEIAISDGSGLVISLSSLGNVVAIGSMKGPSASVFELSNNMSWKLRGDRLIGRSRSSFGASLELSSDGDVLAVGAPNDGSIGINNGFVGIYFWNGRTWTHRGSIYGRYSSDYAGSALAFDSRGETIAVGSPGRGETTVYRWNGEREWVESKSFASCITMINTESRPIYSVAMSLSGKVVAVGCANDGDAGKVSVYNFDVKNSNTGENNPVTAPVRQTIAPSLSPVSRSPTAKAKGNEWNKVGRAINGEDFREHAGTSTALSSDGKTLAVGATMDTFDLGTVRVYILRGGVWTQIGQTLVGENAGTRFGLAVALSGDGRTVVVGSDRGSNGSLRIFVYNSSSSLWVQRGSALGRSVLAEQAGWSISMSLAGDVVAFGAPGSSIGYTSVFTWKGDDWTRKGQDVSLGDRSGHSVDLSGDGKVLAVGALEGSYVKVYHYSGNNWRERGNSIRGEETSLFGASISLSHTGNVIAIGAPHDLTKGANAGMAKVFSWTGDSWVQRGDSFYGLSSFHYFGQSVDISNSGTVVAIGIPGPRWGNIPSSVSIFDWDSSDGTWSLRGATVLTDPSPYGTTMSEFPTFSMSLAPNGNDIAIGSPFNNDEGRGTGKVMVYRWKD